MRRRRIRYRPSKYALIPSLIAGLAFCVIGVTIVIPQAGMFGVLWTVIAAAITANSIRYLFASKDSSYGGEYIVEDDFEASESDESSAEDPEARLAKLLDLYQKGLITREEYDRKKADILNEL